MWHNREGKVCIREPVEGEWKRSSRFVKDWFDYRCGWHFWVGNNRLLFIGVLIKSFFFEEFVAWSHRRKHPACLIPKKGE